MWGGLGTLNKLIYTWLGCEVFGAETEDGSNEAAIEDT